MDYLSNLYYIKSVLFYFYFFETCHISLSNLYHAIFHPKLHRRPLFVREMESHE